MRSSLSRHKQLGFTLLEAVLYLALYGLLMTTLVSVVLTLSQSAEKSESNVSAQNEILFVTAKLNWLINGAKITSPEPGQRSEQLTLIALDGSVTRLKVVTERLVVEQDGALEYLTQAGVAGFSVEQTLQHQLAFRFTLNNRSINYEKQLLP